MWHERIRTKKFFATQVPESGAAAGGRSQKGHRVMKKSRKGTTENWDGTEIR
jgi:hypothetical protein